MPIIKSRHSMSPGLAKIETDKDKFKFTHVEDVEPLAKHCYEMRKYSDNGFSKERKFRQIASIPVLAYYELMKKCNGNVTTKDIKKYLASNEGEMFKTVNKGI